MPRAGKLASLAAGVAMLALTLATPATGMRGNGGALVVGDSLALLASPYLERYLPDVPLTINVEGGYNSLQIFDLFEESYDPSQSVVVFDAGTNDNPAYPEILAGNLQKVTEAIGDRCMVVPTVHGFVVGGVDNTGKNRVVRSFAASRPGTQTPDWARAVATHPELMQSDNLHPIAAGADYRAQLIARGVRGCLASMSTPEPEPTLESGPELTPLRQLANRQSTLARTIAAELAREVALRVARGQVLLAAAALTMAASDA
jgi:hypothetical protein